ncbi:MAG: hypothetical protein WCY29_16185 [Novosphingobium sp.]
MLWFHCDNDTGAIANGGLAPDFEQARLQPMEDGLSLFVVPDGTVGSPFSPTPDFSLLKEHLREQINASFNQFVLPLVSDLVGQDRRYSKKEVEALVWTSGDEAAHPEKYPYMIGEATAKTAVLGRAVAVSEVHAGIMAQILQSAADPVLEGYRVAHRQAVLEAETLPAIAAAAVVDWAAILTALGS